jgi:hypothetical protein
MYSILPTEADEGGALASLEAAATSLLSFFVSVLKVVFFASALVPACIKAPVFTVRSALESCCSSPEAAAQMVDERRADRPGAFPTTSRLVSRAALQASEADMMAVGW